MSILPLLLELAENHPFEDAFGYMVFPEQIVQPRRCHQQSLKPCSRPICKRQCAIRPIRMHNKCSNASDFNRNFEKDGFQISLDTKDFAPNEISVKTVDSTIIVEGKHEEKEDEHGHIFRHFIRKYTLPKEVDINDVISTLSTDGQLTIKAPPKPKIVESTERVIQIQQTGEVHQPVKTKDPEKVTMRDEKTAEQ